MGARWQFIQEQHLYEKNITDVDGINEAAGIPQGYEYAHQLLGKYLSLYRFAGLQTRVQGAFKDWLRQNTNLADEQLRQCESCLREWTEHHLGARN